MFTLNLYLEIIFTTSIVSYYGTFLNEILYVLEKKYFTSLKIIYCGVIKDIHGTEIFLLRFLINYIMILFYVNN